MSTATLPVEGLLALEQLVVDHWPNPRGNVDTTSDKFAELKASIAEQGLLEPIVIGPPLLELDGRHALIAGWRRYTAARELGLAGVPVHQRIDITDARAALRAALAENMAREDMTPLAEAAAIARLVELGDTQAAAAKAVGMSERTARERLRLLDLPKPVRDAVDAGHVPTTCTRQLQLIADASPAAATAIAKRITKGTIRALNVLDQGQLDGILRDIAVSDPKVALARLQYNAPLTALGLSPSVLKDLKARGKKADKVMYGYSGGEWIDLTPGKLGAKLLDEARAAGKLLTISSGTPGVVYLTDAALIERAATEAVERMERAAAKQAADHKKRLVQNPVPAPAGPGSPPAVPEDPSDAVRTELYARAVPHAAAMNTEIGRRLRELRTCPLDEPVITRLLTYALGRGYETYDLGGGYELVDPDRELLEVLPDDSGEALAELVSGFVADFCSDPRAAGPAGRGGDPFGRGRSDYPELPGLVCAAAAHLGLLPDRAIAIADAIARLEERQAHHFLRGARRRILLDLSNAAKGALAKDKLAELTGTWGRDAGGLHDVDMQVSGPRFDAALEQLVQAEHVKAAKDRYTITAAGRKALKVIVEPSPVIDDIDAAADPPQATEAPPAPAAADAEVMLPKGTRAEVALAIVMQRPGITIPEISEIMGIQQNYLYRILPGLQDDGLIRKDGRGWHPAPDGGAGDEATRGGEEVVLVHVTPTHGGSPVEAELQPDPPKGANGSRKVIYVASRTAAWVAADRISTPPVKAIA
ncbi:MAG: ParB/RepB/Spo0J family partition protein [Solirubrobacteraceae bacterium]